MIVEQRPEHRASTPRSPVRAASRARLGAAELAEQLRADPTGERGDDPDTSDTFERLAELSPPGLLEGTTLDEWGRGRLVGTVEQVREQLETWAAVGVDELIVTMGAVPFAVGADDDLEIVAAACSLEAP